MRLTIGGQPRPEVAGDQWSIQIMLLDILRVRPTSW
jgi:hypothetical protein